MKRRTLLAAMGTTATGLSGCLERSDQGSEVKHTSNGVSAVYESFEGDHNLPLAIHTDPDVSSELPSGTEDFVETIDFDESYLVTAQMDGRRRRKISEVVVDELDRRADELHVDIHARADGDCSANVSRFVLIAVTDEEGPPGSVSADWFEVTQCNADYVPFLRLPGAVQQEVDVAFTEGQYETDSTLLYAEAVGEDSTLWKEKEYYMSQIDDRDGTTVLTFEKTTGETAESQPIIGFLNIRSQPLDITVSVTDDQGEPIVDETLTIGTTDPGVEIVPAFHSDDIPSIETIAAFGEYELSIETSDGETFTETIRIDPRQQDWFVSFHEDHEYRGDIELHSESDIHWGDDVRPFGICTEINGWWGYTCGGP